MYRIFPTIEFKVYNNVNVYPLGSFLDLMMDVHISVESRSDDPDHLGHFGYFFSGSSAFHPRTKLSGCDPDF